MRNYAKCDCNKDKSRKGNGSKFPQLLTSELAASMP